MELTKKDRLILYNQYEILKRVDPEGEKFYEVDQEILLNGYKYNYGDLVEGFLEDTDVGISKFVFEVFEMYRMLNNSYQDLNEEEKTQIDLEDLSFKGYDGNEETDYYMYARFLVEKYDRCKEIEKDKNAEMNSHRNMVQTYNKMLLTWLKVRTGKYDNLSLEGIKQILNKC